MLVVYWLFFFSFGIRVGGFSLFIMGTCVVIDVREWGGGFFFRDGFLVFRYISLSFFCFSYG